MGKTLKIGADENEADQWKSAARRITWTVKEITEPCELTYAASVTGYSIGEREKRLLIYRANLPSFTGLRRS